MKNVKLLLVAGFIITLGLIGCKKGDTGPAGATGPAGPDSVVYSPWTSLAFTYVVTDSLFEDSVIAPSITAAILDSGVILTYVNVGSTASPIVASVTDAPTNFGINMGEDFEVGKIFLPATDDYSGLPFRYITIPGSKLEGNSVTGKRYQGYTVAELKHLTYQKVAAIVPGSN